MKSIYHDTLVQVEAVKVADNEVLTGAGVDMLGYEGVAFIAAAGKGEVASFSMKVQQDTEATFAGALDLESTAQAFTTGVATDGIGIVDIYQPQERYVRPVLTVPNLNTATPVTIISIRYGARYVPEDSNVGKFKQSPEEGTA